MVGRVIYSKETEKSEVLLSELNFKIVDLDTKNGHDDLIWLGGYLFDELEGKLEARGIKAEELEDDFAFQYSQGDFYRFTGEFKYRGEDFVISEKGGKIEIAPRKEAVSKKAIQKLEAILGEFHKVYEGICKEMEDVAYKAMQKTYGENVLRFSFGEWMSVNDMDFGEGTLDLLDMAYSTEEKEGYIKVCDRGDTHFKGLWIPDQKVKVGEWVEIVLHEGKRLVLEGKR